MKPVAWWSHASRISAIVTALGCGSAASGLGSQEYGFMVVGPGGADDFGLSIGDSLPEVPAAAVLHEVLKAAKEHAGAYQFDGRCTRYFAAGDHFVALLIKGCQDDEELEDGVGMALLRRDGSDVIRPTPWLTDHYTSIQPLRRGPQADGDG